jgi:hypothetical protein
MVHGYLPGEPSGRELTIYVSRKSAIESFSRRVAAAEMFDKTTTGIAVRFFPDRREDVVVGDAIPYYHSRP